MVDLNQHKKKELANEDRLTKIMHSKEEEKRTF
jgi:hypothetical protein